MRREVEIDWKNVAEQELIEEYLLQENDEIFKEIYNRYKDVIFTYVKRFLCYSSDDIILDLVDEIFIKVYLKLPHLKDSRYFKNWIYRIAHNLCVDYIKSKKHEILDGNDFLNQTEDKRVNIEGDYIDNEMTEYLLNAINDFSSEVRSIIILKFFQGLTFNEISEILKIPIRTLKYKLRQALLKLGEKLKKEGLY